MVDPSLPPAGLPARRAPTITDSAADGRERITADEVMSVVDLHAWHDLRVAARVFNEMQASRKRVANQVAREKEDGTPRKDADTRSTFAGHELLLDAARYSETVAKDILLLHWRATVGRRRTGLPLALLADAPGLAWYSLARLLGETGHPVLAEPHHWEGEGDKRVLVADPLYARTQREWLAYCGFGDPERRRRKGMAAEELAALGSPRAKTAAWIIATTGYKSATGKADKNGQMRREFPWRAVYTSSRERTPITHPEWAPWRHQKSAERVMTKAVLIHIYRTAWDDVYARLGR